MFRQISHVMHIPSQTCIPSTARIWPSLLLHFTISLGSFLNMSVVSPKSLPHFAFSFASLPLLPPVLHTFSRITCLQHSVILKCLGAASSASPAAAATTTTTTTAAATTTTTAAAASIPVHCPNQLRYVRRCPAFEFHVSVSALLPAFNFLLLLQRTIPPPHYVPLPDSYSF